ncbi:MAG: glycosyl transferase [Actinobacteria bacterium]|nr:glycosyl transferase [Actinomycetota bacterium]
MDSTVVFFPEGAYGPTNNCIGIATVLKRRGMRVIFVVEESFAGTLESRGFKEELMRLKPRPEVEEEPGQFWKDFIRETAPELRKSTSEQLETLTKPIWEELIDGAKYVDGRLTEIFKRVEPDVIVQDNVVAFPAVAASGRPWVRVVSCNPLEMDDPNLPPRFSGLPSTDSSGWIEFRRRHADLHSEMHADFDAFCQMSGAPALPPGELMYQSPYLNLYLYPTEADYARTVALEETWHRLDSCVREGDAVFHVPDELGSSGKLIYLSLGSLGSADVSLMNRLIEFLAASDHGVIVSMGPQHSELKLAGNMFGEEFLPQTKVIPQVDLVITHCGNNTVTECFHFGKPMIGLPLFWDQHDNAQRVHELGFGIRLPSYTHSADDLHGSIETLLDDRDLGARLAAISERLKAGPGTERAADLIELLAREKQPIRA